MGGLAYTYKPLIKILRPYRGCYVKIVGHIDSQRCIDTALGLAKGMGLGRANLQAHSAVFSAAKGKAKVCAATPANRSIGLSLRDI
jgi:hypothetical protein